MAKTEKAARAISTCVTARLRSFRRNFCTSIQRIVIAIALTNTSDLLLSLISSSVIQESLWSWPDFRKTKLNGAVRWNGLRGKRGVLLVIRAIAAATP